MDDKIAYYNTIIEELEKCNCKEDFEKLIEGNDFLRENRKYFEWLLDESKNNVLKVYNTLLCNRIMPYYSWVLKAEFNQENFKRNFFNMINKSKKDFKGYWIVFAKIIEDGIIRHQLFENVLSQIKGNIISINPLIGIVKGKYNPFFVNEFELLVCALDSSLIGKLEEKIKSEDFIKKEVIKIVGENNIGRYLHHIAEIFVNYTDILARYDLPIIVAFGSLNKSLYYYIFEYLCGFEDSYKALKNKFDLAIVSSMKDLEDSNKELEKEIEKKKSQKYIIGEVEEVYKQNLDMYKYRWNNINNILLGLSIVGSLLTFTIWTIWFNGLDFYKIIMIKIPFVIIGVIAYRNIQRNRFFKEEYQYKNTVMKIFNQFREDSDDEVRDKSKLIMLEMFKENPNDKLIKKDKYNFKFLNKLINNVTELRKAFNDDERYKEDKKRGKEDTKCGGEMRE
jgi:hypothetical protein